MAQLSKKGNGQCQTNVENFHRRNALAGDPSSIISSIFQINMGKSFMDEQTHEAIRQWRAKAQSDWDAVEILTASKICPNGTVCFHCQQRVGKLLKALLTQNDIEAPKNMICKD